MIALSGELSAADTHELEAPVAEALDRGHHQVVLDLHEIRRAAPDALSALSAALRLTIERGGALSAVGLRPGLISRVEPLVTAGLHLRGTIDAAVHQTEHPGEETST